LHAYDPEDLSAQQRRWADEANRHHARIQSVLMSIAVSPSQTQATLEYHTELEALGHKLTYANLQLWTATAPAAQRTLLCASAVIGFLKTPMSATSLGGVVINAKYARQALATMTDAQRRIMLDVREVAVAKDIADDCEAEFDNTPAWARWRMKAGLERPATVPMLRGVANDNHVETRFEEPQR
jgi:hypothetical protein